MPESRITATLRLDSNLDIIKGLSREAAIKMQRVRMYKIRDLLNYLPSEYQNFSEIVQLESAKLNQNCSFIGTVYRLEEKTVKVDLNLIEMSITDGNELVICTFFKQPWIMKQYAKGEKLLVGGKLVFNFGFKRMTNPYLQKLEEGKNFPIQGQIISRYESFEYISCAKIRNYIGFALKLINGVLDPMPLKLRIKYRLPSRQNYYRNIHRPVSIDALEQAKRRLKYQQALNREILFIRGLIEYGLDEMKADKRFVHAVKEDAKYVLNSDDEQCKLYLKELEFLRRVAKYRKV